MATDTAWRTSRQRNALSFDVERRLLVSYLALFVTVLALFAIVTHFAFATVFDREMTDRLGAIALTAPSVVDATGSGISVDLNDETIRALNARTEGVRWGDSNGRTVASYGLSPDRAKAENQAIRTLTTISQVGDRVKRPVSVVVIVSTAPYVRRLRTIDASILIGALLAIVGSLIAGRWLTRQLVRGLEANIKALRDFTADAAHELRGPLTAVATNAASAVPLNDEMVALERAAMDSMMSATAQMIRVSEDLLTLARANQPLDRELFAVDLDAAVLKIAVLYTREARQKGIELEQKIVDRARVYGNPDQIERIIGNLVENAIEYTPRGGCVTIACTKDRGGSRVTVTDNGIGIAAADLERIFDRFWRADPTCPERGGSGLGLTIARELARRHGGDIGVTSRLGEGSVFTLTFPSRPPRWPRWS